MSVMNATGLSIDISVPLAIAVLTLSAGGVGPSFTSSRSKPHLYDQGKSNAPKASRTAVASFTCTFCDVDFAIDHPKGLVDLEAEQRRASRRRGIHPHSEERDPVIDFGIPPKARCVCFGVTILLASSSCPS